MDKWWIFFVFSKKIFEFLPKKKFYVRKRNHEKTNKKKQLVAYKYNGFWQCMDTLRDKKL